MNKVKPIAGNLHVPAHVRKKPPSGTIRQLKRMVLLANPEQRRVVLAFPEIESGYIIASPSELRNLIEKLTALDRELYDNSGRELANALHKDKLDFAQP